MQEEALLAWFAAEQGVMVCTPTGTGKTLIAEAALFEALHTGTIAYYTTPLIALCEQKFREMQSVAVKWGFYPEDVGLVTGNRRENPNARVLVVVAEILLESACCTAEKSQRKGDSPQFVRNGPKGVPANGDSPLFRRSESIVLTPFPRRSTSARSARW